jgi:Protein of unknown function with PCYCGC motif
MKKSWIMIGVIVALLLAAIVLVSSKKPEPPADKQTVAMTPAAPVDSHGHAHPPANGAKVTPAFFKEAPSRSSLGPTLAPEQFTGLTRDAYRAVREIPVTIAQMPCYCHCDRGMGHKSLYSCFEDDHAAHCAVCVNEALMAYKLEKEGKLTAPQIRDRIVAQFGSL